MLYVTPAQKDVFFERFFQKLFVLQCTAKEKHAWKKVKCTQNHELTNVRCELKISNGSTIIVKKTILMTC